MRASRAAEQAVQVIADEGDARDAGDQAAEGRGGLARGSAPTTVVTLPLASTLEIRPPSTGSSVLPVHGAAAPDAWVHWPTVELVPPSPPSATYRSPSGPKVSPRGLSNPVAKVVTTGAAAPRDRGRQMLGRSLRAQ
jgi:hypothetical protein